MKHIALVLGLVVASGPAWAQSTAMQVYGPGTMSCASYLQDRSMRLNADGWILGFWTDTVLADLHWKDSNRAGTEHGVGHSTDSRGIVGEVARVCRDQPSVSLFETLKQVFDKMKAEGR